MVEAIGLSSITSCQAGQLTSAVTSAMTFNMTFKDLTKCSVFRSTGTLITTTGRQQKTTSKEMFNQENFFDGLDRKIVFNISMQMVHT
jgi:hypothetical protein